MNKSNIAMKTESDILALIESDPWMMQALRTVAKLDLPDWWIGAGFVRNKVWDHLHDFQTQSRENDLDVIYFDPSDRIGENDIAEKLKALDPTYKWEVVNQATVHTSNNHAPYKDSVDALAHWTETATCVGVTLRDQELLLTAPHGIDDLVNLMLRFTPHPKSLRNVFEERLRTKRWLKMWPKLTLMD